MVPGLKRTSCAAAGHTAANIPRDVEAPIEIYSPQTADPDEHTPATAANMPGAAAEHAAHLGKRMPLFMFYFPAERRAGNACADDVGNAASSRATRCVSSGALNKTWQKAKEVVDRQLGAGLRPSRGVSQCRRCCRARSIMLYSGRHLVVCGHVEARVSQPR